MVPRGGKFRHCYLQELAVSVLRYVSSHIYIKKCSGGVTNYTAGSMYIQWRSGVPIAIELCAYACWCPLCVALEPTGPHHRYVGAVAPQSSLNPPRSHRKQVRQPLFSSPPSLRKEIKRQDIISGKLYSSYSRNSVDIYFPTGTLLILSSQWKRKILEFSSFDIKVLKAINTKNNA